MKPFNFKIFINDVYCQKATLSMIDTNLLIKEYDLVRNKIKLQLQIV